MGCCHSTSSNALGDIAQHANNANLNSDAAATVKQEVIDEETSLLIKQLLDQITKDPMIFPKDINSTILWNIGVKIGKSDGKSFSAVTSEATQLVDIIQNHFDQQFETKTVQLHSAYIYMLSEISFRSDKEQYSGYCKYVFEDSSQLLNNLQISKQQRSYLKSILAWNLKGDSKYFIELKKLSQNILTQLAEPLLIEYKNLQDQNDEVLKIEIRPEYSLKLGNFELNPSFIRKEILQISDDIFKWYNKGFIIETKHEALVAKQFFAQRFDVSQAKQWLDDVRNAHNQLEPSLVLRELLWRMALRIDDEFQSLTRQCFMENHEKFKSAADDIVDDKDVGHRSASVKSKSRVWSKVFRDYSEEYGFPDAYFMVQDWIRCAIVVRSSTELGSLYNLLCSDKYFGGKIIRVKNGLETRAKAEFGYRVIMINAVYKGMIVEMQCMLLPFLKMRKKMHVHYKIIRAKKSNDLAQDMGTIIG